MRAKLWGGSGGREGGGAGIAGSPTDSNPQNSRRALFGPSYSASKTALNAVMLSFAIELADTNIKVNAASLGIVATDLNNFPGTRTGELGAREPVRLALRGADGPTDAFSNEDGPIPW